jgi:hypothetical protein
MRTQELLLGEEGAKSKGSDLTYLRGRKNVYEIL